MCPQDIFLKQRSALSSYRRKLCVISYPFPTEDPIVFKREQGTIADEKLVKPLSGKESVPQSRTTVPKIKFIRKNPPVPYTAWHIWLTLWQFSSPTNINRDFGVEYSAILEQCRLFYPPWLSKESVQITEGRLRDALKLLSYAGWIEFREPLSARTRILVHFNKGERLTKETFYFLTKKYVMSTLGKANKASRRKGKMPSARALRIKSSGKNERLDAFLNC